VNKSHFYSRYVYLFLKSQLFIKAKDIDKLFRDFC